jgi:hypothetical protein
MIQSTKGFAGLLKPLDPTIMYDVIHRWTDHYDHEINQVLNDKPLTSTEAQYFAADYLCHGYRIFILPTQWPEALKAIEEMYQNK